MKSTLCWFSLAALTAAGCVDQRSAMRRSQRSDGDIPFWNVPAMFGSGSWGGATAFAPPSFLFPTAAVTREDGSLPMAFGPQPGMAPIFDVFRGDLVSERGTTEPLPMPGSLTDDATRRTYASWSDRVAAASADGNRDRPTSFGDAAPSFAPPAPPSLPRAIPVPGKAGFVTLPGRSGIGEIDVVGIPSGTPVEVPAPGGAVQFIVP